MLLWTGQNQAKQTCLRMLMKDYLISPQALGQFPGCNFCGEDVRGNVALIAQTESREVSEERKKFQTVLKKT